MASCVRARFPCRFPAGISFEWHRNDPQRAVCEVAVRSWDSLVLERFTCCWHNDLPHPVLPGQRYLLSLELFSKDICLQYSTQQQGFAFLMPMYPDLNKISLGFWGYSTSGGGSTNAWPMAALNLPTYTHHPPDSRVIKKAIKVIWGSNPR